MPVMAVIVGGVDIGERTIARADEMKSGGTKGKNREQEQYEADVARRLMEALRLERGQAAELLLPHCSMFPGQSHTGPISSRQLHRAVQ